MRLIMLLISLLLVGCGMTDDEVRAAKRACEAKGGTPVEMVHLNGSVGDVRCW